MTQGQVPTACIHVSIDLRGLSGRLRFLQVVGPTSNYFSHMEAKGLKGEDLSVWGGSLCLERSSVPKLLRVDENLVGQRSPGFTVLRSEGRKPF